MDFHRHRLGTQAVLRAAVNDREAQAAACSSSGRAFGRRAGDAAPAPRTRASCRAHGSAAADVAGESVGQAVREDILVRGFGG